MSRIGIDVGGTNTDAVLLEGGKVLAALKRPTTVDVADGVRQALVDLVAAAAGRPALGRIEAVMIGTTHFTNAVVERRHLDRVAALRIGLPTRADARHGGHSDRLSARQCAARPRAGHRGCRTAHCLAGPPDGGGISGAIRCIARRSSGRVGSFHPLFRIQRRSGPFLPSRYFCFAVSGT
ncbi:hypothetical protein EZH22_15375 [Xanthobacter dioxanivorans]|uniref:Hydantoinase/oxoprolinase N-terminal domain-containing protein n=1 Tax=Xanthobacter dioxanivorans TaxID=2528964 RepID=A0A974SGZ3_9HYPH|nr:hypothetical protein EZH22_15375 [Xanthobacter dioxanivorans]